jgi:hypothetical protein
MIRLSNNGDLKTIIFILVVLVFGEVFLRNYATALSGNIKHIETFQETAINITENDNETVLFIGSSLVGNAVDQSLFSDLMGQYGISDIEGYKIVPDASSLWDWYCIVKNDFSKRNDYPGVIVSGFAWGLLSDQERPMPSRLGGHLCNIDDLPDLYDSGLQNNEDIIEYLIAMNSVLFVNRHHIKRRILEKIIFNYQSSVQLMNNRTNYRSGIKQKNISYSLLKKYISLLRNNNVKTIFLSMPVIDEYAIDKELVSVLKAYDAYFFDYRHIDNINEGMFKDPIHLDPEGRKIFTERFAQDYHIIH